MGVRRRPPGNWFPFVRLVICFAVWSFPNWRSARRSRLRCDRSPPNRIRAGETAGPLYAANTAGAAIGLLAAGYFLIPAIGVSGTTLVGVTASAVAIVRSARRSPPNRLRAQSRCQQRSPAADSSRAETLGSGNTQPAPIHARWPGVVALVSTGFATFLYEIAWTRVFSISSGHPRMPLPQRVPASSAVLRSARPAGPRWSDGCGGPRFR